MISEHDDDMLPRCRRLGHEITFGYCRRENFGQPCRLIFDCWWEQFNVQSFLKEHLAETMAQLERAAVAPPQPKVQSLVDLIQKTNQK